MPFEAGRAQLAVRVHDIQNDVPPGKQIPGQTCPVGARAFDAEGFDPTKTSGPRLQVAISLASGRDRRAAQPHAPGVDCDRDVIGFVGVHADDGVFHACPLLALAQATNEEDRTVKVRDRRPSGSYDVTSRPPPGQPDGRHVNALTRSQS